MLTIAAGLWLLTALLMAVLGRRRGGRALDFLFLSLVLTPVVAVIALIALSSDTGSDTSNGLP